MALARRLERYWHNKGYWTARFWAVPIGERFAKIGTYDPYRVACNLVNGLPRLPARIHKPPHRSPFRTYNMHSTKQHFIWSKEFVRKS
jgi:hypothetical protein